MTRAPYLASWHRSFLSASSQSAAEIVPLLMELFPLQSVVDVGCGLGAWLREFQRRGVEQVLGIDGDHVDTSELLIDHSSFVAHDLNLAFRASRTFDLAVCLEVAEHLPEAAAMTLVKTLSSLSGRVFFSAAVPDQGGTHHVNEQWLEYWVELFRGEGLEVVDAIRPRIWNNDRVDFWYAQNAVLFVRGEELSSNEQLQTWKSRQAPFSMIHPKLFSRTQARLEATLDYRLERLARRVRTTARRWVHG